MSPILISILKSKGPFIVPAALALIAILSSTARSQETPHRMQDGVKMSPDMHEEMMRPSAMKSPGPVETADQVGGMLPRPPVKALPALECRSCCGPSPAGYCLPGFGERGFLYYGTSPYGDDPFNGFRDCPNGSCGDAAAAWTIRRVSKNQKHESAGR